MYHSERNVGSRGGYGCVVGTGYMGSLCTFHSILLLIQNCFKGEI